MCSKFTYEFDWVKFPNLALAYHNLYSQEQFFVIGYSHLAASVEFDTPQFISAPQAVNGVDCSTEFIDMYRLFSRMVSVAVPQYYWNGAAEIQRTSTMTL